MPNIISTEQDFLSFIRDQAMPNGNLSMRGVERCCGIAHLSLIKGGRFESQKLGQILTEQGFQAGGLVENGFPPQAVWLCIEYFAFDSKAKAPMAKQLARTFGSIGIQTTLEKLGQPEQPKIPLTFSEALLLAGKLQAEKELLEIENQLLVEDNERQAEAIDELFNYSSILRVAKFNNCSETLFNWRRLKAVSLKMGLEIKKVPCPRFGTKNLYCHDAWRFAYPGFNLPETTTLIINPTGSQQA